MRDATLCIPIIGDPIEKILLGYKKKGFGKGKYTGFGGKVETGETIDAAVLRETREEVGLVLSAEGYWKMAILRFIFPFKPTWSQQVHVYLASTWEGDPQESTEMLPAWFSPAEAPYSQMWADAAHWLPPIIAGRKIYGKFIFQEDNETIASFTLEDMDFG